MLPGVSIFYPLCGVEQLMLVRVQLDKLQRHCRLPGFYADPLVQDVLLGERIRVKHVYNSKPAPVRRELLLPDRPDLHLGLLLPVHRDLPGRLLLPLG